MRKRFSMPLNFSQADPTTSKNEVVNFEDYSELESVVFVGSHGDNANIEIDTHDGKDVIVDNIPISYYKQGSGREELEIGITISNNAVRVKYQIETGADLKGALVFTLSK